MSFSKIAIASALVAAVAAVPVPNMMAMSSSSMMMMSSSTMMSEPPMSTSSMMMSKSMMYEPPMSSSSKMYEPPMSSSSSMMYQPPMYSSMAPPPMYTSMAMSMSTSASMAYSTPSYGSGSWNNGGYNDCVSKCIAQNGGMSMDSYKPSSTATMGSSGSGATHTVIVAPSQGVLRYVPMAVNAAVGDTILFQWNANNHTVTKSSALEVCNKTKDALFASGTHDKGFTFTQVVNDTKPTFFYCATPTHCQKGMFGIINPAQAPNTSTCASSMMPQMMNSSMGAGMASQNAYMSMMPTTPMTSVAANWGANMDMSTAAGIPQWAQQSMAENIMYTRSFLAANPDVVNQDGSVDLGKTSAPLMIPQDLAAAQNNAATNVTAPAASASASSSVASSAAPTASGNSEAAKKGSGAISVRSSGAFVGVAAVLVAFVSL